MNGAPEEIVRRQLGHFKSRPAYAAGVAKALELEYEVPKDRISADHGRGVRKGLRRFIMNLKSRPANHASTPQTRIRRTKGVFHLKGETLKCYFIRVPAFPWHRD